MVNVNGSFTEDQGQTKLIISLERYMYCMMIKLGIIHLIIPLC